MPLVLYRYILRDLLKLLGLTAATLTLVMSVGFMIKPVSEGTLGAASLAKLLFFVSPAMLTYALPIAAAFAATLIYFRISADNEVTACAMSGISYRSLLLPPLALGVGLTLLLFFLANWVIPGFWQRVEALAQQDIARVIVDRLKRHEAVRLNEYVIYADFAEVRKPDSRASTDPDKPQWFQRIVLWHPVVAKMDPSSRQVDGHYTGESAVADLYRHQGKLYAMIKLTYTNVASDDQGARFIESSRSVPAQEIPSFLETHPQFLSLPELRQASADPEMITDVRKTADRLRQALARRQITAHLAAHLGGQNPQPLKLRSHDDQLYTLTTDQLTVEGDKIQLASRNGRNIRLVIGPTLAAQQIIHAASGTIEVQLSDYAPPSLHIKFNDVQSTYHLVPTPAHMRELHLTGLKFEQTPTLDYAQRDVWQLLDEAQPIDDSLLQQQTQILRRDIAKASRRALAAVHQRAAMAVAALLVLLLGAVMSMALRQQVPLVTFFWCFLPTIALMISVNSGQNMIANTGMSRWAGIAVAWGSLAAIGGLIALVYRRLARH